ncbi:PhoX family protein [Geodermatophilus sp. SYSU D00710]
MTLTPERPADVPDELPAEVGFDVSDDPDDTSSNPTTERPFWAVAEARLSRRSVIAGGMLAAAGFLTSSLVRTPAASAAPGGTPGAPAPAGPVLGFQAIAPSTADEVVVPPGYTAVPFIPWGTPITGSFPAFRPGLPTAGGNTADEQAQQVGTHHDGMTYFPVRPAAAGNQHGVLVLNHEYTDENYLQTGTSTRPPRAEYTAEMVRKSQNAHGVSVVEVRRQGRNGWTVVRSPLNRRITATTPMAFSGPAAGSQLLRTAADPAGRTPLGTINNCGNGETPWGTYLTCEENFNGYFRVEPGTYDPADQADLARYGVGGDSYYWADHDPRFVVRPGDAHEPNRFGWVVEIDPLDPRSVPVKRTALGRLKHEDATAHTARDGRLVVYMGDDQVNEYVYKYVSARPWEQMRRQGVSPLDEGTLYVARFAEDGTGTWIPLVHGQNGLTAANGFADQAAVLVRTRQAATRGGATPMDRPEWSAVDPRTGTVYLTLTNNTTRATANGPNPRVSNRWGHVVRWEEAGGDHTATSFRWDLFLLAGPGGGVDGSTVAPEDAFGSPDGLWVDPDGRAWIQTDGTQPAQANNQMLAADASAPFDQEPEVRRFLTGVVGCEVTGIATTPDRRTLFVNLQHPGENGGSTWPRLDGVTTPRSATVVITKDDGGVVGS